MLSVCLILVFFIYLFIAVLLWTLTQYTIVASRLIELVNEYLSVMFGCRSHYHVYFRFENYFLSNHCYRERQREFILHLLLLLLLLLLLFSLLIMLYLTAFVHKDDVYMCCC